MQGNERLIDSGRGGEISQSWSGRLPDLRRVLRSAKAATPDTSPNRPAAPATTSDRSNLYRRNLAQHLVPHFARTNNHLGLSQPEVVPRYP